MVTFFTVNLPIGFTKIFTLTVVLCLHQWLRPKTCSLFLSCEVEAAGGKALACVVDIRDEKQVEEAVQQAVDKFGGNAQCWTGV